MKRKENEIMQNKVTIYGRENGPRIPHEPVRKPNPDPITDFIRDSQPQRCVIF